MAPCARSAKGVAARNRRSLSRAWLLVLAVIVSGSCKTQPPPAPQPLTPLPTALAAAVEPSDGPLLRYEIRASEGASELRIEALFPAGTPAELAVDRGFDRYLRDVELADSDRFVPLVRTGTSWRAESCVLRGCRLRYRFLLAKAAEATDDVDEAMAQSGVYLATPPTWLLRPREELADARARLHVSVPPGVRFVSGIFPLPGGGADTYEADLDELDAAPYSAFGALQMLSTEVMGGRIEIAILPDGPKRSEAELVAWVTRAARLVGTYFAGFPVPRLALFVVPTRGAEMVGGTTMGHGGAAIVMSLGRETAVAELQDDWMLPHEMIHLAMSALPRHRWLKEGIATYVEPIIRARAGERTAEDVWSLFLDRMKNGLPGWRDKGLDNTPSWGRVYWGGALFCLLADIEIRERTHNRKSVDDAFRAIVRAGGNIAVTWDIEHLLQEGDRGTGVPVLSELYGRMANQPVPVDLPALWRRLGIYEQGDSVRFDDTAPLAAIRRSITARP